MRSRITIALLVGLLAGAAGGAGAMHLRHKAAGHGDHGHEHEEAEAGHDGHDHGKEKEGERADEGLVRLSEEARKAVRIRLATVEKRRLGILLTATGGIRPNAYQVAHVSPKVPGKVAEVSAFQGTRVKRGDPLLVLDSIEMGAASADFLKTKSALEVAKINFEREDELMKRNATRGSDFYEARGTHLKAQADFQAARGKLLLLGWAAGKVDTLKWDDPEGMSRVTVTAPVDGEVTEKHATIGELVGPDAAVFTISNLSTVWVELDLFQRDAGRVHEKQPVEIVCDAHPGKIFKAQVTYVGQSIAEETRTLKVRVEVDNRDGHLKPGMFVTAHIRDDQDEHAPERLTVPEAAVQRLGPATIVFIAKAPGIYEKRPVTLGRRNGEVYEVVAGVAEGESVVTEGGFILKSELLRSEMGHDHAH
jgi:cobalt-zinc-cadmium efflux system membrane fusion protein